MMETVTVGKHVKLVLVEDHNGTRAELAASIQDFADRVSLIGSFAHAHALLASPLLAEADVVLLDLGLPDMSGIELIQHLAKAAPHVRALALTVFQDETNVIEALSSGAVGYLTKDEPMERVIRAVEEAHVGEHPVSSRVIGFLLTRARRVQPPVTLTFREQELATLLAEGMSYAECGERMDVSVGTVQSHVKNLYRKLQVSSRAEVRDWVRRYL